MVLIEFTIEPFVEGQPGSHVTAAIDAARAHGVGVEIGPFGSSCLVPAAQVGSLVADVTNAAFVNGATHVSVHAERVDDVQSGASEI
ncbi:MAG: hypothetical protein KUG57_06810 [Ilumatobacteraceae bacterium]|nr:hypothetical protein [Ilumatobacteraceae bacterium]